MTERRQAAVLIAVRDLGDGDRRLVLIRRGEGGIYSGGIALPGGNAEPDDSGPQATAVREVAEELGIAEDHIEVLSALEPVDTLTTGYTVTPFIGRLDLPADHAWRPEPDEIEAVVEVDIAALAAPQALGEAVVTWPAWSEPRAVPARTVDTVVVWGLTLRILEPLLPGLADGSLA